MNLAELDELVNQTPVMVHMQPVSAVFFDRPVRIFSTAREMALALDTNVALSPERWITFDTDSRYSRRFPEIACDYNPFTSKLNHVLLEQYSWIAQRMLTQPKIAERISSEARGYDTVVLILLDGLSYADCLAWPNVEPCLAVLPTITRVCFPVIVNTPPIASRLFTQGFQRRVGFTYWTREDNILTDQLFSTIRDIHIIYSRFAEVVDWLRQDTHLQHTYIQIVRSALDDYADGIRVTVPRAVLVQELWNDILAVTEALKNHGLRAKVYITADHGLLWKDDEHTFETLSQERGGMRYGATKPTNSRGLWVPLDNSRYWVLDYPQLRRNFYGNEQGTHGGISFEECITPFVTLEV
jgi:hypothetical protein